MQGLEEACNGLQLRLQEGIRQHAAVQGEVEEKLRAAESALAALHAALAATEADFRVAVQVLNMTTDSMFRNYNI